MRKLVMLTALILLTVLTGCSQKRYIHAKFGYVEPLSPLPSYELEIKDGRFTKNSTMKAKMKLEASNIQLDYYHRETSRLKEKVTKDD